MNKYEKIYAMAKSRRNPGGNASWIDVAIAPLAVDIEERTGEAVHIGGPFGLRAEAVLSFGGKHLTITPNFEGGELTLYYDTGKKKGRYDPGTFGYVNGFDNLEDRLPDTLEEIIEIMTKKQGGTDDE